MVNAQNIVIDSRAIEETPAHLPTNHLTQDVLDSDDMDRIESLLRKCGAL